MTVAGSEGSPSVTWHHALWKVRWFFPILGAAIATLVAVLHSRKESDARIALLWLVIAAGVVGCWWIAAHPRLTAAPDGITVRNRFDSVTIPWGDIAELTPGAWGMAITRKSGSTVNAEAVQKTNVDIVKKTRTRADAIAEYLTKLVGQDPETKLATLRKGSPVLDYVGFTASGKHQPE